jgi:putative addiction module component (TIGR02574 family)
MTAALKSMAETVEKLPAEERAYLAERLIASLDESKLDAGWTEAVIRRRAEIRSGKETAVPADEAYRRIERLLATSAFGFSVASPKAHSATNPMAPPMATMRAQTNLWTTLEKVAPSPRRAPYLACNG